MIMEAGKSESVVWVGRLQSQDSQVPVAVVNALSLMRVFLFLSSLQLI